MSALKTKVCDKCGNPEEATSAKCSNCSNDTFTPVSTVQRIEGIGKESVESHQINQNLTHDRGESALDYQSAIGHFLRAIWFIICAGIVGDISWSNYSWSLQQALLNCQTNASDCDAPTFGIWIIPAFISMGFVIVAVFAGSEALKRLKRADARRR